jgi:hypothetical protein
MFLYRLKIDDLDAHGADELKDDLMREGEALQALFPIREMSVLAEGDKPRLDVYLALDDIIGSDQLRRLSEELNAMVDAHDAHASAELIHV